MTHAAASLAVDLRRQVASTCSAESLALCTPLALLLARHLRFDAADPLWPDRDRLVLSSDLEGLGRQATARLGAGPGLFHTPDQALGAGVGMAAAERMLAGRFGRSLVDHRSWVMGGGATLAAGHVQEAAGLAALWRLCRLTMIVHVAAQDAPGLSGFAAHGWSVRRAALGRLDEVEAAISAALRSARPTLIACVGQQGSPTAADEAREDAGERAWEEAARRAAGARRGWLKRLARHASRQDFEHATMGRLPAGWHMTLAEPAWLAADGPALSTARAVRGGLADLAPGLPSMALLPGDAAWIAPPLPADWTGTRERAGLLARSVAAGLAGIGWHGGVVPLAAHRLDQSDEIRPALADAARHGLRLLQILVEPQSPCAVAGRRAALRAMRGLATFRPADAAEALECLELALRRTGGPSVLLLSEAAVAVLAPRPARTRSARGGHVVSPTAGPRQATLLASGPELHVALAARALLGMDGLAVAVVSLPCWSLFAQQDEAWRAHVLGDAPRIGVEAGSGFGWERWLGAGGLFVSLLPDESGGADGARQALTLAQAVRRHLGGPQAN